MRLLVSLLFFAVLGVGVWRFRDELGGWVDHLRSARVEEPVGPSAELAMDAERKLASLIERSGTDAVVLTEAEVQSLVLYRLAPALPPYVDSPRVELEGDRIRVHLQVATDRFPRVPELRDMMGFLPDKTDVSARAQLIPLGPGRVGLAVDDVTAAKIPVPRRFIPALLERLGRVEEPGLPPDAVAIPLPPGAAGAYVRGGSLVFLTRAEPGSTD